MPGFWVYCKIVELKFFYHKHLCSWLIFFICFIIYYYFVKKYSLIVGSWGNLTKKISRPHEIEGTGSFVFFPYMRNPSVLDPEIVTKVLINNFRLQIFFQPYNFFLISLVKSFFLLLHVIFLISLKVILIILNYDFGENVHTYDTIM